MSTAAMVKNTMELIKHKRAHGIALSVPENEFLAECRRIYHAKPQERMVLDSDGSIHIVRSVETSPVIAAVKAYGEILDKRKEGAAGARLFGSIDPITAAVWARETGLRIGTKEFAEYAKKRLNSDFSAYKVHYA